MLPAYFPPGFPPFAFPYSFPYSFEYFQPEHVAPPCERGAMIWSFAPHVYDSAEAGCGSDIYDRGCRPNHAEFNEIPEEPNEDEEETEGAEEDNFFLQRKKRLIQDQELFDYEDRIKYWLQYQQKEQSRPKSTSEAIVKIKKLISFISTEFHSKAHIIKLIRRHACSEAEPWGGGQAPIFRKLSDLNKAKKLSKQTKEALSDILSDLYLIKLGYSG